jgi:hypothetical protein
MKLAGWQIRPVGAGQFVAVPGRALLVGSAAYPQGVIVEREAASATIA